MIHSNDDYFFLLTDNNKLIYISVYKHRMGKTKKMWIKFYQIYVKNKIEKKNLFQKKNPKLQMLISEKISRHREIIKIYRDENIVDRK